MGLAAEDLNYIKSQFNDWISEFNLDKPPAVFEMELRERIVRVEEELKHQRELMNKGFAMMELRFEDMNKRFEAMQIQMDQRFEAVDKRFEMLTRRIDRFMFWSFSLTVASAGTVIAVLKFL